jgi:hypothetical protein
MKTVVKFTGEITDPDNAPEAVANAFRAATTTPRGVLFASRIAALPTRTRQLLLLMGLDGTDDLRVLQGVDGLTFSDLDAAERASLAHMDRGTHRLAFRHPLIRAAVVELSTADQRRRANRALAELWVDQPDRRAWHLAEATINPDEDVAAQLEQAARGVLARGDVVASVAAMTRASELSPQSADRNRRLAAAAYIGADVAGELRSASRLLDEMRRVDPELTGSLQAAGIAAAVLLNADGDVDTAHRLLVAAIESRTDHDNPGDTELKDALHTLLQVCHIGSRSTAPLPDSDPTSPGSLPGRQHAGVPGADHGRGSRAARQGNRRARPRTRPDPNRAGGDGLHLRRSVAGLPGGAVASRARRS